MHCRQSFENVHRYMRSVENWAGRIDAAELSKKCPSFVRRGAFVRQRQSLSARNSENCIGNGRFELSKNVKDSAVQSCIDSGWRS